MENTQAKQNSSHEKRRARTKNIVFTALFAALIAAGAFVRIPLFGVPFTMQLVFVTAAGFLLGAKKGAAAVLIYILLGLAGVPIFAAGGGIFYVLQPTFGYPIGFVFCAFITGLLTEKMSRSQSGLTVLKLFLAGMAGVLAAYAVGVPYFYLISKFYLGSNLAIGAAVTGGFLVTIGPDIIFTALASMPAKRLVPMLKNQLAFS